MFSACHSFNQPLNDWDVSNVKVMSFMFYYCFSFNQNISNWNVSNVKTKTEVFEDCPIKGKYKPKFK
jgi:surface protein